MKFLVNLKKITDLIKKNFYLVCAISLLILLFILSRSGQPSLIEGHNMEGQVHTHDVPLVHEGPQGPPGPKGDEGDLGLRGKTGGLGLTGEKGNTGEQGPRGPTGNRGYRGYRGARGFRGQRGRRGFRGPPGERGLNEREEDLINTAIAQGDTLQRGLMQAEEEIDAIKNAVSLKSPEIKIPKLVNTIKEEAKPAEGFLGFLRGYTY